MYGQCILGKMQELMVRATRTEENTKAIDEWLKKNKVTECPAHVRTDPDDIVYKFKAGKRARKGIILEKYV